MRCIELPLLPCLIIGGIIAYLPYHVRARKRGVALDIHIAVHSITLGLLLAGALHLFYGGLCPNELVEVYDQNEMRLHPPHVTVKIEMFHRIDILIGSGFLVYTTGRALEKIYRNPAAH